MALPEELQTPYRQWWLLVQKAASPNLDTGKYDYTVTDLITAAADLARSAGSALSFATGTALSRLFGTARGMERAADALTNAALESGIESSMVATAPFSRSATLMAAEPQYQVKTLATIELPDGTQMQQWFTATFTGTLPPTVGDMRDQITQQIEDSLLNPKYEDMTFGSVSSLDRLMALAV